MAYELELAVWQGLRLHIYVVGKFLPRLKRVAVSGSPIFEVEKITARKCQRIL
jgi:hypothetical protein